MPDSSRKLLGIPIYLCHMKRDAWPAGHFQKRLYFPAKHSLTSRSVCHNWTGVLTSLTKPEVQIDIPAITREYKPGACCNSRKLMRLPPRRKMRPDSPAFPFEEFVFPIKDVSNLDFPDGTEENPQEHCHNKRRTLMSPQECKIDWCNPNQLKMKHNSPSLIP